MCVSVCVRERERAGDPTILTDVRPESGAITFSIMALSLTTFSITTVSIKTLSIIRLFVKLSITTLK